MSLSNLQFDSFADFLAMGGHGVFVWAVYALTFAVLTGLALSPLMKKRRFLLEQSMRIRREQAASQQVSKS